MDPPATQSVVGWWPDPMGGQSAYAEYLVGQRLLRGLSGIQRWSRFQQHRGSAGAGVTGDIGLEWSTALWLWLKDWVSNVTP